MSAGFVGGAGPVAGRAGAGQAHPPRARVAACASERVDSTDEPGPVRMLDVDDPRWARLCLGLLGAEEAEQLRLEAVASSHGRVLWDLFRPIEPTLLAGYVCRQRAAAIEGRARYWEGAGDEHWPEGARVTERAEDAAERCWYRAGALRRVALQIAAGGDEGER